MAELTYDNTFTIVLSLCLCRKCREFTLFHRKSWLRGQEAGKIKEPCHNIRDTPCALDLRDLLDSLDFVITF